MHAQRSSVCGQKRSNHIHSPSQKRMRCGYQYIPYSDPHSVHHRQAMTEMTRVRAPSQLIPHQQPFRTLVSNNQKQQHVTTDFAFISSFLEGLNSFAGRHQPRNSAFGFVSFPRPEDLTPPPKQQTPDEDSMGLDFDHAKLKVRHESSIRALYADLPRQCTTCGMRFKTQEKHSEHMDGHVRKNRAANRSSKPRVSRNYFLSSTTWIKASGTIGNPTGPTFFPTDKAEKEDNYDELFAVPADEDQKECPLCMERFVDYFSDEEDDWMYKGAVYLSEDKVSSRKLYKSLLGRIVHAKCINA